VSSSHLLGEAEGLDEPLDEKNVYQKSSALLCRAALVEITLKLPGETKKRVLEVLEEELAELEGKAACLKEELGPTRRNTG